MADAGIHPSESMRGSWQKKCPGLSCGAAISVRVNTCPHCGYDLSADRNKRRAEEAAKNQLDGAKKKSSNNLHQAYAAIRKQMNRLEGAGVKSVLLVVSPSGQNRQTTHAVCPQVQQVSESLGLAKVFHQGIVKENTLALMRDQAETDQNLECDTEQRGSAMDMTNVTVGQDGLLMAGGVPFTVEQIPTVDIPTTSSFVPVPMVAAPIDQQDNIPSKTENRTIYKSKAVKKKNKQQVDEQEDVPKERKRIKRCEVKLERLPTPTDGK